ncbi:nuclear transport factor 2 family protein [Mesobacterium sp. TK19101]|uniref:Nuclear transport factor 2 family protein n=1 Tax=Mesobacterium hydrothermale TaxID=3111907 RepID=A0ABU6HBT7_9RHOB|nr:nuclear transport factor 2 family protein [Mesobacterium sp. TK19101]MEC3859937.1 nuclear transport factor 2 family protein [Mesobacterium sp. TK19101]
MDEDLFSQLAEVLVRRDLGSRLGRLFTPEVAVWWPFGQAEGVGAAEMALLPLSLALPRVQVRGEDLISDGSGLAAARLVLSAPAVAPGVLGAGAGAVRFRVMAELDLRGGRVARAVLIPDSGAVLTQAGQVTRAWAVGRAVRALPTPAACRGDSGHWARAWGDLLEGAMRGGFSAFARQYDPAAQIDWPGGTVAHGPAAADALWLGLRGAFPSARFTLHHRLGRADALMPPRASVRWRLVGRHDGWGPFGAPSGAEVTLDGISMVEFGPEGIRREWTVYDEAAIWAQIGAGRS